MSAEPARYFPLGESAITVEFGNVISETLNDKAIELARRIEADAFPGFVEAAPAYCSATIFFDRVMVRRAFPEFGSAFDAIRLIVEKALSEIDGVERIAAEPVEIPVDFSPDAAPDLHFVAEHNSISPEEVIAIFTGSIYRVYMLGFLPGFTYMGELDERVATPRKETPRTHVPKGSVGIAGRQTGIYSLASPGGWQIVGRTPLELFTPDAETPSLLKAGDHVRFVAI